MPRTQAEKVDYRYFAFISYSHGDKSWAKRLQGKLERYRLPTRLQRKYQDAPKRAYPVFRDDTDLAGFKVRSSLERELRDSQYLIVICSPRSAASEWVNDEVRYFIDHGREDRILPVIVEGTPYAQSPEEECFPPALRQLKEDPLGIDVRALGWRKAYIRVISTLLNVKYDELLMRDTRRRARGALAALCAAAVLAVGAGQWIWYNTEHSRYYNAYTYRYEIPVGIRELSQEERSAMSDCYRVTTLRGKVIRLECVNALGAAVDPRPRNAYTDHPILEFQYDDSGALISVLQKDAAGVGVSRKTLTANPETNEIAIDFHSPSNSLDVHALSSDMSDSVIGDSSLAAKSEITRQRNTYDDSGCLIRSMYQRDSVGTPACDSNGVYGKAYEYNDLGLVKRVSNLDENGNLFNCKYGWAYEEFTYDGMGNAVLSEYYNADGEKTRGKDGYAATKIVYDAYGNAVQAEALDETGQRVPCAEGYCVVRNAFDGQGFLPSAAYFDGNGDPTCDVDGVHGYRYEWDALGRNTRVDCLDLRGELLYSPGQGFASLVRTLDENGRVLEERLLDAQGGPAFDSASGACGFRYTYDGNGYLERTECLDGEGNIAVNKYGYAVWVAVRDDVGNLLREEYRDASGSLVRSRWNNAVAEYQYDLFGNVTQTRYLDEEEAPCFCDDGYAIQKRVYESGRLVSRSFYGTQGEPVLNSSYYHRETIDYDEKGNPVRWSYYDTEDHLIETKDGYAILEKAYDSCANVIRQSYFMADGQPAYVQDIHSYEWEYDSRGNQIRQEVHSSRPEGQPYLIAEAEYDSYGRPVELRYYDENGQPIPAERDALSRVYNTYDSHGNLLRKEMVYGTDDAVSVIQYKTYDEMGNCLLEQWFRQSSAGEAVCVKQTRMAYDACGNCVRTDYLDGAGSPSLQEEGWASWAKGYSPQGYAVWAEYYDENGQPCLYKGAFRYECAYDARGNCTEERRYDIHGALQKESSGIPAICRYGHDVRGRLTYGGMFNENGEPFAYEDGSYSSIVYLTDDAGFQEGRRYYDKEGNLLAEYAVYVYIAEVYEEYSASRLGVQAGQFILRLGDWNYYETYPMGLPSALRAEMARTTDTEKELVLCQWTEEDTFVFHSFHMPQGVMGILVKSDVGNVSVLKRMEEAYSQWLETRP